MNKETEKKYEDLYVYFIILLLVLNVIWHTFGTIVAFIPKNVLLTFVQLMIDFNNKVGLFNYEIVPKIIAAIVIIIWAIQRKGKKNLEIDRRKESVKLIIGIVLYFGCSFFLTLSAISIHLFNFLYITSLAIGVLLIFHSLSRLAQLIKGNMGEDIFNKENETFPQDNQLRENEYSINLETKYYYKNKYNKGYINVVNPFRATIVLGTPGSGKSYAIINPVIRQHLSKGFTMFCYDFKFPTLTEIAYANFLMNKHKYPNTKFYVINFDDPEYSCRCNPLAPELMTDILDAYEASYVIMLNLNKSWIQKQGDFFVESPIILFAAIIWFLKIYKNGIYCTFPHAVELLMENYESLFEILNSYEDLANYLSPFMDAWQGGAQDQLQGQIASAKIPLARMVSPQLYWVMTGNDFTLDLNNPDAPKVLCVGNNPDRKNIYGTVLGLYNSRVTRIINKPKKKPCSLVVDELATIYFRGLDDLIATGRSNKIAICLGFQDMSQLVRDYGDKEAKVIQNTVGNIFSGQVSGDSAKWLSTKFGKNLQKRESISNSADSSSVSISYQQDVMIPESAISSLSQGQFVGTVVDDFSQRIEYKVFNCEIQIDPAEVDRENKLIKQYKTPKYYNFKTEKIVDGNKVVEDKMDIILRQNYKKVKEDIKNLVKTEIERISKEKEFLEIQNNIDVL
jgi:hypothetical protein